MDDRTVTQADIRRENCVKRLNEIRHAKIHADIKLAPEQEHVLKCIKEGRNVMLTGEGGSGKTVTLMAIIKYLSNTMNSDEYAICASTGKAAIHLQVGTTIHSVFKLIPGSETLTPEEHYQEYFAGKPWLLKIHKRLKVIVIDETSMLDARALEKVDYVCRKTSVVWNPRTREEEDNRSHLPFGGKRIVLCGDFFQLPPVFKSNGGPNEPRGRLLFQSESYINGGFVQIMLMTNHRQRTDLRMQYVLNCIRRGEVNDFAKATLGQLRIPLQYRQLNGLDQVSCKLHCTNENVEVYNLQQLQKLPYPEVVFEAEDNCREGAEYHLKTMRYPKELTLRPGAKVRLLKNLDLEMNLANGSPGVVIGIGGLPDRKDDRYRMRVANMDTDPASAPYVRVRFWLAEGVSHDEVIGLDCSEVKGSHNILASRKQFPLALTFATTIHNAQGQTHPCFELDLSNVFEAGQGYVGLSRGTTLNGIHLSGFDASRIRCDPAVVEFYKQFETPATIESARLLEEKAKAMGPYKITWKDEFKELEGTIRTDFEDIEESNRLADLKRKGPAAAFADRGAKRSKTGNDEAGGGGGSDDDDAPPMYLCVTGSKHITDRERFNRCLGKLVETFNGKLTGIVTGDKDGVEKMAADFAAANGLMVIKQTLAKQPGKDPVTKKTSKRKRLVDNAAEIAVFKSKEHECKGTDLVLAVRNSQPVQKKVYNYNF